MVLLHVTSYRTAQLTKHVYVSPSIISIINCYYNVSLPAPSHYEYECRQSLPAPSHYDWGGICAEVPRDPGASSIIIIIIIIIISSSSSTFTTKVRDEVPSSGSKKMLPYSTLSLVVLLLVLSCHYHCYHHY